MKRLHCKKCDYATVNLPSMAAHYRKKHPSAMKRRAKPIKVNRKSGYMRDKSRAPVAYTQNSGHGVGGKFCSNCGVLPVSYTHLTLPTILRV